MRLLSIFALLFLFSFFLHDGLEDRAVSEDRTLQEGEEATDAEEAQASGEDFSSLVFKQPYPARHFEFEHEDSFNIIETELKNLVIGWNDSFKKRNSFCAVGYEFPRTQQGRKKGRLKREVIIYWREGRMLYRWEGGDPKAAEKDFYSARSLLYSPHSISLDAPGEALEDISGDDPDRYKERAENVIADCEKHGKQYVIEPFVPPPRGFGAPGPGRPRVPAMPAAPAPVPPSVPASPPPEPPVSDSLPSPTASA